MSELMALVVSFTERQHGVVARWQLLAAGADRNGIVDLVRRGALVAIHDGVYRLRGAPFTQELRWLAGVLASGPESWLSHRAAAMFHGYDARFVKPEVTIGHDRECEVDGVVAHRTRRRRDVITVRGIPVTTKPRTILDCAAVMPYGAFETMVQDAVAAGLVKVESLYAILDRRGGRGVTGVTATRRALSGGLVDERIQKRLELIVARIIDGAAVLPPVRQYALTCSDGRVVVLDNAWPDRKLAVEAVGMRWHGNAHRARRDRARRRSIVATGWDHYDYGWSEATETPALVRAEIESFWAGSAQPRYADPTQNADLAA